MARSIIDKKASKSAGKPATTPAKEKSATRKTAKPIVKKAIAVKLPAAMTGRASAHKAKDGDEPVFAYIRSLPQPQRGIAEHIDQLAAKTLPGLRRSVKWGISWYGVGDGWCFCCGGFASHVKLMFGRGTSLKPVPPIAPVGMGKETRGMEPASLDNLDEHLIATWMKQATALPGFGGKKR